MIEVQINRDNHGKPTINLFNKQAGVGENMCVGTNIGEGETVGAALDRINAFERMGLVIDGR